MSDSLNNLNPTQNDQNVDDNPTTNPANNLTPGTPPDPLANTTNPGAPPATNQIPGTPPDTNQTASGSNLLNPRRLLSNVFPMPVGDVPACPMARFVERAPPVFNPARCGNFTFIVWRYGGLDDSQFCSSDLSKIMNDLNF